MSNFKMGQWFFPFIVIMLVGGTLHGCTPSGQNANKATESSQSKESKKGSTHENAQEAAWQAKARQMVNNQIKARGVEDQDLLAVMKNTPRHQFVPEEHQAWAYRDRPLPIGHDQTISQPYIVALMTELLDLSGQEKVLEIGTGSGYQASILAQLADHVYTIEIVEALANTARSRLNKMDFNNVEVKHGNGYLGWPEHAPFDRIIVTAAPDKIPSALKEQLKKGGKMVSPVGDRFQQLKVITKNQKGNLEEENITGVRFVPMVNPPEKD